MKKRTAYEGNDGHLCETAEKAIISILAGPSGAARDDFMHALHGAPNGCSLSSQSMRIRGAIMEAAKIIGKKATA